MSPIRWTQPNPRRNGQGSRSVRLSRRSRRGTRNPRHPGTERCHTTGRRRPDACRHSVRRRPPEGSALERTLANTNGHRRHRYRFHSQPDSQAPVPMHRHAADQALRRAARRPVHLRVHRTQAGTCRELRQYRPGFDASHLVRQPAAADLVTAARGQAARRGRRPPIRRRRVFLAGRPASSRSSTNWTVNVVDPARGAGRCETTEVGASKSTTLSRTSGVPAWRG
jgi:hypothetical protein